MRTMLPTQSWCECQRILETLMSASYFRERCAILEKENERLKEEVRKLKKDVTKYHPHDPNCDGDLWICADCRGK